MLILICVHRQGSEKCEVFHPHYPYQPHVLINSAWSVGVGNFIGK
ncbi:hypothetical protein GWI33_010349 [Rhynchophorus ferrugineus]|uniref:Uncharacterized protein n=1 Tax=Rhynchophorus ferrugineus TaxID=354439 RepID=A0A834ICC0_RHYFE|nr:hypothetical protein GWI33_010349 [Rhynchophorus ferrugineus]